ncbi:hypothetical protein [Mycobacterium sp.]|uniref:hypothetical protein n=1 Tax=Mycobacterium sp. TaxID=1785 RepID=UPI0031DE7A99
MTFGRVERMVAAALWTSTWQRQGFQAFAETAVPQSIRWESRHGWTRYGDGPVAMQEPSLAVVLARMLRVADTWEGFAEQSGHDQFREFAVEIGATLPA